VLKRSFDIAASLTGLVAALPLFAVIGALIKLDSPGPVLFRQVRIGRHFRPFVIYKFRTMTGNQGPAITAGNDGRITRLGRLLRKGKLDELPQLFNVLVGEMSLVGPRPEVPRYVALFETDYQQILSVRPGLTDFASLKYRDEAALLAGVADPEHEYITRILPDKIRLAREYTESTCIKLDLHLILKTVLGIAGRRVTL
jgi:lipopolysaccharide/colanic/teichoic acid biosynthesis glycosyltransferase